MRNKIPYNSLYDIHGYRDERGWFHGTEGYNRWKVEGDYIEYWYVDKDGVEWVNEWASKNNMKNENISN